MSKPKKIIIVGASWASFHNKLKRICEEIAEEKGLEFEEKVEDFVFLSKYGEKDELGGADIPQVFIEYDDGTIKHVLTKVPVVGSQPDFEAARRVILEALGE